MLIRKFDAFTSICVIWVCCSLADAAFCVDEDRLWLPVKYHKLYLDLKESAQAAEKLENCQEVLKGTIDREQSKPDHPIFRIQCRRPDGISYNEMVDGVSKKTLTTVILEPVALSPEELERLRLEKERRIAAEKERNKHNMRDECFRVFEKSTELMLHKDVLTPKNSEPEVLDDSKATFHIDFNARSVDGRPLRYRAICDVVLGGEASIAIKPRR